jgi:hypothetical protein
MSIAQTPLQVHDVDLVIAAVRAYELDPQSFAWKPSLDDQPVLVASDVEDDALDQKSSTDHDGRF